MFQYAYGRALAAQYAMDLRLDLSYLLNPAAKRQRTPRHFCLDVFDLDYSFALPYAVAFFRSRLGRQLNKINLGRVRRGRRPFWSTHLVGYWQGSRYFQSVADTLRQCFRFKPLRSPASLSWKTQIATHANSVMIHVRRGDYVGHAMHEVCTLDYFSRAMKYMQVHVRDATFFVFSDDMAWCRQAFHVVDRISFVEGCTGEDEELQLMTHCRHHIISNSSFSWWGAWLGTYADKIVLTPSRWSPDATLNEQFMERDGIIPQDWIQIEV